MSAILGRYSDNIVNGSTVSGTTPVSGYSLSTVLINLPSARVRFTSTSITVTFTLTSSQEGAVFILPMHNITPSTTGVATLTNSAGLSYALTTGALMKNGLPAPIVADFSASANRTSGVWNLVVAGNAANVQLGGAIGIYGPKRTFSGLQSGDLNWQYTEDEETGVDIAENEYLTEYVQDYETSRRIVEFSGLGTVAQVQAFVDWFQANHGKALPSLFWPDPPYTGHTGDSVRAYFGRWISGYQLSTITGLKRKASIKFRELSRGKPIL